jgi:quinol monooxygenase YgiN
MASAPEGGTMTSTTALVRHRVANFDAWKSVYDTFAPIQAEHGVRTHQVLRSQDSPNDLVITHTFDDLETAKAFFAMPELKKAMNEAGVHDDSVKIAFYDEVEAETLISV